MKFLQLLGKELNEWPPKADWSVCVISTRGEVIASFGRGDKPKPDTIDRKFHTWTIWEPETNAEWLGEHRVLSEKASDQLTAIVTRADWEAERAKLKAPKANGDGWVRHRGGKCPVDGEIKVETRQRGGQKEVFQARDFWWEHRGNNGDIMAYRIHKPVEQPALVSEEAIKTAEPCKFDAIAIRNRIRALDTQRAEVESTYQRRISEITQERESLVQKLAGEGLALVEVVEQPVKSLEDWRNWQAGDVVEVMLANDSDLAIGSQHVVRSIEDEDYDGAMPVSVWGVSDYTWPEAWDESWRCVFKFVSRPAS